MTPTDDVVVDTRDELTDAELLTAVRSGDREALGSLFERCWPSALAIARSHVRDADQARECAAEGFARVIAAIDAGGGPTTSFHRYLATAVRHTALEHLRRAARSVLVDAVDDLTDVATAAPPDHRPDHDPRPGPALNGAVGDAFVCLIEPWREVLWLTEVEGFSTAELAEHWGVAPNTVAARAYRARQALREGVLARRCTTHEMLPAVAAPEPLAVPAEPAPAAW